MDLIPAKTIISRNKTPNSWFGHDYNFNGIYGRCGNKENTSYMYRKRRAILKGGIENHPL